MIGVSYEQTVSIGDDFVKIYVTQQSKSVYVCTGQYRDNYHSAKARSSGTAVRDWVEWANRRRIDAIFT